MNSLKPELHKSSEGSAANGVAAGERQLNISVTFHYATFPAKMPLKVGNLSLYGSKCSFELKQLTWRLCS